LSKKTRKKEKLRKVKKGQGKIAGKQPSGPEQGNVDEKWVEE